VVKLGISRRIVDQKVLREGRDLMMFLPQEGKASLEEGGDVYLVFFKHTCKIMMYG
jgi:hypothetical protein